MWEDTVMGQDDFEEWCGSHYIKGCGSKRSMCEDKCRSLAQAEISFKVGQQNGLSLEMQGEAYCLGVMAGIREVVEWIEVLYPPTTEQHPKIVEFLNLLQAKLKEWGIK